MTAPIATIRTQVIDHGARWYRRKGYPPAALVYSVTIGKKRHWLRLDRALVDRLGWTWLSDEIDCWLEKVAA